MTSLLKTTIRSGLCLAALVCAADTWAQSTSAALAGTVRTEDDRPITGAVVQARSISTGTVRSAVTGERGDYRIDLLAPGDWTVVARLTDGQVSGSQVVTLRLQQTIKLDFTLGMGLAERMTVRAETPLVDRKESAGKLLVTGSQAADLPLDGRVFTDLALLDSSVRQSAPGNFFGERGSVLQVNGQSGRSNSFLVDGLDNNDQTSNTSLNSFYSQQVIREFVLLTHQFSPEFGRASGGVLNIVTHQGTNEHKWEGFAQGSAAGWNETGDFVESLPDSGESQDAGQRFQAGVRFGGPIRRDKAFYFVAFEHQESDDLIPYTGIDRDGVAGGRLIAPNDDDNLFARLDFNLTPSNTLMLRLSADDRTSNGINVGGIFTPEAGFRIEERDVQLAAAWTSVISSNLISETRFLVGTSDFDQFANSDRPGVSRPSGIFGGNTLNQQLRGEDRIQLVENLTWRKGAHTAKFGVDVLHSVTDISANFNPNGNFIYDVDAAFEPGDCGDLNFQLVKDFAGNDGTVPCPGILDFDDDGDGVIDEPGNILTYPTVFTFVDGQPSSTLRDTRIGLFAQDRWQVNAKLGLDYGLRYDFNTYRLPADLKVESSIPNGGAGRDYDNVAPRFGFTFTPKVDGRWVVRGGGGVFYDKLVLAFPAVSSITSGTEILFSFPQGFVGEITEDVIESQGIEGSGAAFFPSLALKFSTETELETPYTVQYSLGAERELGKHGAVRIDATRILGYHLPLMKDLNPVICVPDPNNLICPQVPLHIDTTTGSIAVIATEGRSWYSGVDLAWLWRKDATWFSAGYTWSDSEDMGFDPLKGGISLPPDSMNLAAERGRSDGVSRHRFVVSGDFPVPGVGLRSAVVVQLASGIPFNVTTGQDDNLDGVLSDRPDGVKRNQGEDSSLEAINALRVEANRTNAALGLPLLRNVTSLEEPSFYQVDLRLYKRFAVKGEGRLEAFLQVFNILDRENPGLIEGRAISQNLGRTITLAGPPRTLEVGFRVGY